MRFTEGATASSTFTFECVQCWMNCNLVRLELPSKFTNVVQDELETNILTTLRFQQVTFFVWQAGMMSVKLI